MATARQELWRIPLGEATIHRTLPMSGGQVAIAIDAGPKVACPLQGLVQRCCISTDIVFGPVQSQQYSDRIALCLRIHNNIPRAGMDQDTILSVSAVTKRLKYPGGGYGGDARH
jgi:hypothetical protein